MRAVFGISRDIKITEEVLKTAARRYEYPNTALPALLNRDKTIQITEPVLEVAMKYYGAMEMLLSRHLKSQITELVVKSDGYMTSSGEVVELILSRDDSIRITQTVVEAAEPITQEYSLIKLLVDRGSDDIKIMEEILKVVAQKLFVFIMPLLLD